MVSATLIVRLAKCVRNNARIGLSQPDETIRKARPRLRIIVGPPPAFTASGWNARLVVPVLPLVTIKERRKCRARIYVAPPIGTYESIGIRPHPTLEFVF